MIINEYKKEQKIVESLCLTKILCDKCKKTFVLFENNKGLALTTFRDDYVTIQITENTKYKKNVNEKHFCLDCWSNVKELLTFE